MATGYLHNSHLNYRPDIDGLRALAILPVLVFHSFPQWLPGGFIGVDIFFVISGYLITSIIFKAQQGGGFSLLEFYSRRIKRIFPALILVLVFCLTAGWHLLQAGEYQSLGKHVAAGAGYVSNIVLMGESGYFATAASLKPLLHLWSLGIEEQFYLAWPLVLMLVFRAGFNLPMTLLLLLAVSFSLNIAYVGAEPIRVFYLPFTRSWELLIGSALAYVGLYVPHDYGKRMANLLAWLGFALIATCLVTLHKSDVFPGWLALIPTLGAALLIAAGSHAWFNRHILANKPAIFIGLISYPLYLWHWPLLSLARIVENETPSAGIRLAALGLSFGLAWGTFWLIEKRLRFRSHWSVATGMLLALIIVGMAGYAVTRHEGYPNRIKQIDSRAAELGDANWVKKGLTVQPLCVEKFGAVFSDYCVIQDIHRPPTILLLGDSTANHFFPALAGAYSGTQENILNLGQGGCMPFEGINIIIAEGNLHCGKVLEEALSFAERTASIKIVAISTMGQQYIAGTRSLHNKENEDNFIRMEYSGNPAEKNPYEMFRLSMQKTMRRLMAAKKEVVFIASIPRLDFSPSTCLNIRPWQTDRSNSACTMSRSVADADDMPYRALVGDVLQEFPGVKVWDPSRDLCDNQSCWAMKDGVLLYRDEVHLSEPGSIWLGSRYRLTDSSVLQQGASIRH
jgi:peptidoglycan/LPS O-acetylase OafA/YrhL